MPEWTAEHVERLMVAAFAALPSTPVFSPVRGDLRQTTGETLPCPMTVLAWSSDHLGRDSPERLALLMWARHRALPKESLRSLVADLGWDWSTFNRRRRRGADLIAANLHLEGVPFFDVEFRYVPKPHAKLERAAVG